MTTRITDLEGRLAAAYKRADKRVYFPCEAVVDGPYPDGWKLCERPVRGGNRCEAHSSRLPIWP